MTRFYVAQDLFVNAQIELPSEVVRHIHVLRLRVGDDIELFNGNGFVNFATITQIEKRHVLVLINSILEVKNESPLKLTLAMCLISNDKMDLTVQKATELGVNLIVPIISERSQRIDKDRLTKRIEHWQSIIINSCEQSGRNVLPQIETPILFNKFLQQSNEEFCKIILSPHVKHNSVLPKSCSEVVILIGPEGGFTNNEVDTANAYGFISLLLGSRILRAETAAISALTIFQSYFGDF